MRVFNDSRRQNGVRTKKLVHSQFLGKESREAAGDCVTDVSLTDSQ